MDAAGTATGDLAARLRSVRERIAQAAACAKRPAAGVQLVAVSKTHPACAVNALHALDPSIIMGENRVQEALGKASECPPTVSWHLVGPLQKNKINRALDLFRYVHSVDSWDLLQALDGAAERRNLHVDVLLEVNVGGEDAKHGFQPSDPGLHAGPRAPACINVRGLMTVPPWSENPENARPHFAALRALAEEMQRRGWFAGATPELSMGMSNDFEVAITEGATLIRVGTALFGGR